MIGKIISHYKIIEEIGAGGMGVIYKAEDTKLKRTVALKFLPPELTRDADTKERFIREAQAASAMEHPNICNIHEIDETADGQLFIVMACYEGETLKLKIEKGKLKIEDAIDYSTQITEGLARAHEEGIVHRDIKPANIIITDRGEVKILDFGLAKLAGQAQLTKDTSTLGTVAYMSPEQAGGKEVDQRTDIWSLGVVLYEMLTGELPFKGEYEQAIIYAILNEEPKSLGNIQAELQDILKKALCKNPDERYQHAKDIIEDLESIKTPTGTKKSKPVSTPKKTIGNKWVYLFAAVLVIVVLSILTITNFFSGEPLQNDHSIAVLPFKNLSANQENEYFCDGITEDIIAQLSKISDLKVISRTSIMQYKTVKKSLPEIAEDLNVTMILEGTVRLSDDRIRIVAQLIEAKEDKHIWAETYDREMRDIFAIQSDVAEKIASVLKVELSPKELSLIQKKPTENLAAYNFYIKGREYYHRYQKKDNEQAIRMFKKALEIDPNYTLAYAGLGDAYSQRFDRFGFSRAWIDSAIRVSKKAIELDPDCAEAYKALGLSYDVIDRSGLAIKEYKKAIELNPGYFPAVGNIGFIYLKIGHLEDALKWIIKRIDLNPALSGGYVQVGLVYNALCEDLKAQQAFQKALELNPQSVYARWGIISLFLEQDKYDQALAEVDEILKLTSDSLNACTYAGYVEHIQNNLSESYHYFDEALKKSQAKFFSYFHLVPLVHLGALHWKNGEIENAKNIFSEFLTYANKELDSGNESWAIPYNMAGIYSMMEEKDKALLWLDRAIDAGWRDYRIGMIEPLFEKLRQDNRFKKRIARVKGLVDKAREQIKATGE
ncbi:MAG: protein kinase [Calditrichia bacterium]|nr:protein kinase [Calditrichia bacterium]